MATPLRVLIVEDSENDALLLVRELKRGGYDIKSKRVDTPETFLDELENGGWEIILSDYSMPYFSGLDALEILNKSGIDLPFILVSGVIGEDVAVEAMLAGTQDYIIKGSWARLIPAIKRELQEVEVRKARRMAETKAQKYLNVAGVLLATLNSDGELTMLNEKGRQLLNVSADVAIGQNWFDHYLPKRLKKEVKEVFSKLMTGEIESAEYYENPVLTSDGEEKLIAFHNTVLQDENGNIVGVLFSGEDITERKQAEEALREKERMISLSQSVGKVGSWTLDLVTGEAGWSEEVYNIYELPLDYIPPVEKGMSFYAPEYHLGIKDAVEEAIANGTPYDLECEFIGAKGTKKWILTSGRVRYEDGKAVELYGAIQDITERKNAEESLRKNEENIRLLLESTVEGIYGVDLDGNCTFANPSCAKILGYDDVAHLLGKNMHDLIHHTRKDGTPYPNKECKIYKAFREGKPSIVDDEVLWRSDGTSFPAEYRSHPIRHDNKVIGTVVTFLDITERKKAEEAIRKNEKTFRLTLDATSDGSWSWNIKTGEVSFSNRWLQSLGYTPDEVEPNVSFWEGIVHPDDMPKVQEELKAHFEGLTDYYQCEDRLRMKSGEYRWNVGRGRVVERGVDGEPLRMVGTDTNISDRKKAEEAMRISLRRLSEAERLANLGSWIFDISENKMYLSEQWQRIHGVKESSLSMDELLLIAHPDDADAINEAFSSSISEGKRYEITHRIIRRDNGEERVVQASAEVLVKDEHGKPLRMFGMAQDITERIKAEKELKERSEEMDTILKSLPDLYFRLDLDGTILEYGAPDESLLFVKPESFIGKSMIDMLPKEVAGLFLSSLKSMSGGQTHTAFSYELPTPSGNSYFEAKASLMSNNQVIVLIRDLTQQRVAEKETKHTAIELQNIIDTASAVIIGLDKEGRVNEWNSNAAKVTGFSKKYAMGKSFFEHFIAGTTEEQKIIHSIFQNLISEAETTASFRCSLLSKKGTDSIVLMGATPRYNLDGDIVGVISIGQNITELTAYQSDMEQKVLDRTRELNTILTLSTDGFVLIDDDAKVIYANPAFLETTGFESSDIIGIDEKIFGKLFYELCDPDVEKRRCSVDGSENKCFCDNLFTCTTADYSVINMIKPTNRIMSCRIQSNIDTDPDSKSKVLYFRDITHESEVDQMKSEFLSTAAHELRTPLASILGFSELLLMDDSDELKRLDFISTIHRQSYNLKRLLDELLDLARIEARAGKDFDIKPGTLEITIKTAAKEISTALEGRGLIMNLPDTWPTVAFDYEKIHQALLNVLSNAVKYSTESDITLSCSTRKKGDGSQFGVTIKDSGTGMTPEELSRMGERFYRADKSGKIPGTGLGLALVKEIVKVHQGEIDIESEIGKGTTVTIWLSII